MTQIYLFQPFNQEYSLVPELGEGLQGYAGIWTGQACGESVLQALFWVLQRRVEYLRVHNAMCRGPGQSNFPICSQVGWKAPAWGAFSGPVLPGGHTMEKATPASGSLSLPWEALLQPKQQIRVMINLAMVK